MISRLIKRGLTADFNSRSDEPRRTFKYAMKRKVAVLTKESRRQICDIPGVLGCDRFCAKGVVTIVFRLA